MTGRSGSAHGIGTEYIGRGWVPVLVRARSKAPTTVGWQNARPTAFNVDEHVAQGGNVGILLGAPSGGLVDIDLDCPEALAAAPSILSPTGAVFGRVSKLRSHYLYVCEPPPQYKKFEEPARRSTGGEIDSPRMTLLELRTSSETAFHQTIFPGSVHPTGELIEWNNQGEPMRICGTELECLTCQVAAAALLARHWPGKGDRHQAHLALHGMLLRAGWLDTEVVRFSEAISEANGDGKGREHVANVRGTAERYARGEGFTAGPRLAELVGEPVVSRARDWLGLRAVAETPQLRDESAAAVAPRPDAHGAGANCGFKLTHIGELLSRPDTPEDFVWEGRLARGTVSIMVAKPKVGKSTVARNLTLAVSHGEPFLDQPTKQGECIYLALEECEEAVKADFRALGATGAEPIFVHAD